GVDETMLGGIVTPGVITVDTDKGFVEVKNRKFQWLIQWLIELSVE
ncbi:MAG: hypothetical protein ACI805_002853, partial [Candidatus Azotimanducaceae bacterium]